MNIIIWDNLSVFLPEMVLAFFLVFLITPLIGKLAGKVGAIDLPARLRSRLDKTRAQRIHKVPKLKLGGVGVILVFGVLTILFADLTIQMRGILLGVAILFVSGFLDDKYELSAPVQLGFQFTAAVIAVLVGISITHIGLFGSIKDLSLVIFKSSPIHILNFVYIFRFPADIITIFWILILVNALNWMCGIDGLGEGISIVASATIGLIGIKLGHPEISLVSFILTGSILGFLPYNFPPSKILGGTVGEINYGFLLATLSILSGAKLTVAILLMIIPLSDMIFVLIYRMLKYRVINPLKLLSISGRIHLHHRLMDIGLSGKLTLYFELTFFLLFAVLAFIKAGFRIDMIIIFAGIVALIFIFLVASILTKWYQRRRLLRPKKKVAKIIEDMSPEEKYKY